MTRKQNILGIWLEREEDRNFGSSLWLVLHANKLGVEAVCFLLLYEALFPTNSLLSASEQSILQFIWKAIPRPYFKITVTAFVLGPFILGDSKSTWKKDIKWNWKAARLLISNGWTLAFSFMSMASVQCPYNFLSYKEKVWRACSKWR